MSDDDDGLEDGEYEEVEVEGELLPDGTRKPKTKRLRKKVVWYEKKVSEPCDTPATEIVGSGDICGMPYEYRLRREKWVWVDVPVKEQPKPQPKSKPPTGKRVVRTQTTVRVPPVEAKPQPKPDLGGDCPPTTLVVTPGATIDTTGVPKGCKIIVVMKEAAVTKPP